MSQICPEIFKLKNIFKGRALPEWFLVHAKGCQKCLFIITHKLAAVEALLTTNRVLKREGADFCPSIRNFFDLLVAAVHMIWVRQERNLPLESFGQNIIFCPENSLFPCYLTFCHTDSCGCCQDYYAALYQAMLKAQKRYEEAIRRGQKIKPVTKISARVFDASQIIETTPCGKPN